MQRVVASFNNSFRTLTSVERQLELALMQIGLVLDLRNQRLHRKGIVRLHLLRHCVVTLHTIDDAAEAVQILSIHLLLFIG